MKIPSYYEEIIQGNCDMGLVRKPTERFLRKDKLPFAVVTLRLRW